MKKIIFIVLACIGQTVFAGDVGVSLNWTNPLFGCVDDCSRYKFTAAPRKSLGHPSTKDGKVSHGWVDIRQHMFGYWAPKGQAVYLRYPLWNKSFQDNKYTYSDIYAIAYHNYRKLITKPGSDAGNLMHIVTGQANCSMCSASNPSGNDAYFKAPMKKIINWTHGNDPSKYQDPHVANHTQNNGRTIYGYGYGGCEGILNSSHHDRLYDYINQDNKNVTTLTAGNFKVPENTSITLGEYFNGVGNLVVVYFPLHMVDPTYNSFPTRGNPSLNIKKVTKSRDPQTKKYIYTATMNNGSTLDVTNGMPDLSDPNGFYFKSLRQKQSDYSKVYEAIGF